MVLGDRANTHAIESVELTKQFDSFVAVDRVSFAVGRGEISAFWGCGAMPPG